MPNPTITKEQFNELQYRQSHMSMEDKDNVWSVHYVKNINPNYYFDEIEVKWFCGTERYSIYRQTKSIRNIPLFEGSIKLNRRSDIFRKTIRFAPILQLSIIV